MRSLRRSRCTHVLCGGGQATARAFRKTGKGLMVAQVPQRDMFRKYGWPAAGQIKELLEELKEGM